MPDDNTTPARIWLLLGEGDGRTHTWCDNPDPTGRGEIESVEYIRADLYNALADKWEALLNQLGATDA